jgi:hypothetical protein
VLILSKKGEWQPMNPEKILILLNLRSFGLHIMRRKEGAAASIKLILRAHVFKLSALQAHSSKRSMEGCVSVALASSPPRRMMERGCVRSQPRHARIPQAMVFFVHPPRRVGSLCYLEIPAAKSEVASGNLSFAQNLRKAFAATISTERSAVT